MPMKNKLPRGWIECTFDNILEYEQPTKYIVENTKYDDTYETPVLTAGKGFILGYTSEKIGIFPKSKLPVIIFDDFTTSSKLVNFPFKVKSSAMKILHPKKGNDIKFAFYLMQIIQHKSGTHKRYWISEYAKRIIKLPSLPEQEKIVSIIESAFAKVNIMEKNIDEALEYAKELKQSILKQAFSGTLVQQNPNDKPASVLLQKIKVERENKEKTNKKGEKK